MADPAHGSRLVALLALATLLAASLGTWVLKSGRRRWLESGRRRALSVFQLGLRWLHAARNTSGAEECEYSSRKWCSTSQAKSIPRRSASST